MNKRQHYCDTNTLVGQITRHAEVNYYKYKTGRAEKSACRFCEFEKETTRHMICDCEALANKRRLTLETEFSLELCFKVENIQGLFQFRRKVFE